MTASENITKNNTMFQFTLTITITINLTITNITGMFVALQMSLERI